MYGLSKARLSMTLREAEGHFCCFKPL